MENLPDFILIVVILLNFFLLGTSRLGACVQAVALQGALLSLLPPLLSGPTIHALALAVGAFCLKGLIIPTLLLRAIRKLGINREIEPRIGYIPTLLLVALFTAGAFVFGDRLPLISTHMHSMIIPASLATLAAGFLTLITRRKAITQVLGYLIFENGIFVFGMLLAEAMPLMVEAGVLLDMLVAIFVMGIVMNHISREFSSSVDTDHLNLLRE